MGRGKERTGGRDESRGRGRAGRGLGPGGTRGDRGLEGAPRPRKGVAVGWIRRTRVGQGHGRWPRLTQSTMVDDDGN